MSAIDDVFALGDEALLVELDENQDDVEMDPGASQDYPMYSQSQLNETLQVCDLCNSKTRSRLEFQNHMRIHPKCEVCAKVFISNDLLNEHIEIHKKVVCTVCNMEVEETMLTSHTASHSVADNYRLGLTKSKSKKTKTSLISDAPPKNLNGYHIFCREFREGKRNLFPQAKMIEINRLLRDDRHKLSPAEKAGYKPTNLHQLKPLLQSQCRSQDPFQLLQGQLLLFRQQHLLLLQ